MGLMVGWGGEGARSVSSGVGGDIVKVGKGLDQVGIEFSSSFHRKVGDGAGTSFWNDMWIGECKLKDRFPRLYHLERRKEAKIVEKGRWIGSEWKWVWEWSREPRGRGGGELEELESILNIVTIDSSCRDT